MMMSSGSSSSSSSSEKGVVAGGGGGGVQLQEDGAWLRVIELGTLWCLPMALRAAIKLNLLEILAAVEPSHHLSATEILSRMKLMEYQPSISNPTAHIALDRILRVLASHDVLCFSLHHEGDRQLPVRKYGHTAVSRYFASGPDGRPSFAPVTLMNQQKVFMDTWQFLEQAVLEGGDPFILAHGQNASRSKEGGPLFDDLFNTGMANHTKLFIPLLLASYDRFDGINTLVDVGGGVGTCLSAIVSKYPHIKGINYDQPHVVASATKYAGVEHVGGDMFQSVPHGDAIFMKWILHNWSDEQCVRILKNCYKAIPQNGKVIVVDALLPNGVETSVRARVNFHFDLIMFALFEGGQERTEQELRDIATIAGFKEFQIITRVNETTIVELHKI